MSSHAEPITCSRAYSIKRSEMVCRNCTKKNPRHQYGRYQCHRSTIPKPVDPDHFCAKGTWLARSQSIIRGDWEDVIVEWNDIGLIEEDL